jgi:hypothetical protein
MANAAPTSDQVKPTPEQIDYLKRRMRDLAGRNPSWQIEPDAYKKLFKYLAIQKITYLYDDELFEYLNVVDYAETGKPEELVDAYMILDNGDEIQLKLFQFKYSEEYKGGISTKDLFAFVDRMNRVFLHGDLQDQTTLDAYREVREALDNARRSNRRARTTVQCYYIVNGQNVSSSDASKVQEIRDTFAHDRQSHGFTFETYGGFDLYSLCVYGRIPIQEEVLELDYDLGPGQILHHDIGANPNGMPIRVVVGFANVNQLIRLVDRYSNNELFEKNVRLFLGAGKDVNRKIIETVTSNASPWFGFMNNGVSVTADSVLVDLPPANKKVRVRLKGMQIINGCQTVNALYHAKYSPDLKDRFQGNSNVLVRIYQVEKSNEEFLSALIQATNSQNAIRPEDLLSNDPIQIAIQRLFAQYGIAYERKEGESKPGHAFHTRLTKEQAGMAYLAVYQGKTSKLRNSLSRKEFFREGDEYYTVFNLRGGDGEEQPGPLPEGFEANEDSRARILQILSARCLEEESRRLVNTVADKADKGHLRKGAYYLARIVYLLKKSEIDLAIEQLKAEEPRSENAKSLIRSVRNHAEDSFEPAKDVFLATLRSYLATDAGNEDAALKNSKFARAVDGAAQAIDG